MIQITEGIEWDNAGYLHEQTQEAQEWYQENIAALLSFNVAKDLKEKYLRDNNLPGVVPEEKETDGYKAEIDEFCRPSVWKFEHGGLEFRIQYTYMDQSPAWRLDRINVKIQKNG